PRDPLSVVPSDPTATEHPPILPLHDALPISTASKLESSQAESISVDPGIRIPLRTGGVVQFSLPMSRFETNNQFSTLNPAYTAEDRKSTRLNSSHQIISYAVFCLTKNNQFPH